MTLKTRLDRLERQAGAIDPLSRLKARFGTALVVESLRYLIDVLSAREDDGTDASRPPAPLTSIEPILAAWPHNHPAKPAFDWIEKARCAPDPPPFPEQELSHAIEHYKRRISPVRQ